MIIFDDWPSNNNRKISLFLFVFVICPRFPFFFFSITAATHNVSIHNSVCLAKESAGKVLTYNTGTYVKEREQDNNTSVCEGRLGAQKKNKTKKRLSRHPEGV